MWGLGTVEVDYVGTFWHSLLFYLIKEKPQTCVSNHFEVLSLCCEHMRIVCINAELSMGDLFLLLLM